MHYDIDKYLRRLETLLIQLSKIPHSDNHYKNDYRFNTFGISKFVPFYFYEDYPGEILDKYLEMEQLTEVKIGNLISALYGITYTAKNGYYKFAETELGVIRNILADSEVLRSLSSNNIESNEIWEEVCKIKDFKDTTDYYENPNPVSIELITELNERIIESIAKKPELMYQIEPFQFEELIGEIFKKLGTRVTLTKKTRDSGIDIIAFEDTNFSKNKYLIQCKRNSPQNKVGIGVIQRMIGVHDTEKATKSFLVTSSFFTEPAKETCKLMQWNLELKDYNDIINWLNLYWNKPKI